MTNYPLLKYCHSLGTYHIYKSSISSSIKSDSWLPPQIELMSPMLTSILGLLLTLGSETRMDNPWITLMFILLTASQLVYLVNMSSPWRILPQKVSVEKNAQEGISRAVAISALGGVGGMMCLSKKKFQLLEEQKQKVDFAAFFKKRQWIFYNPQK